MVEESIEALDRSSRQGGGADVPSHRGGFSSPHRFRPVVQDLESRSPRGILFKHPIDGTAGARIARLGPCSSLYC